MKTNHLGLEAPTPSPLHSFLELSTLSALAIVQPVLDVMGRSPSFFLFNGYGRSEIILFVIALITLPPIILVALAMALGRVVSQNVAHTVIFGSLLTLLSLQIVKNLAALQGLPLVGIAAALAFVTSVALRRWHAMITWMRYMTPAPIVFAAIFLLISPVSPIITSTEGHAASAAAGDRPPLVMILLDELPLMSLLGADGEMDSDLFPNFARLAQHSTWFRNTTTVSNETLYAVPALLTGTVPRGTVTPVSSELPHNLFALLRRTHELKAFEATTALCPVSDCGAARTRKATTVGLLAESLRVLAAVASPYPSDRDAAETLQENVTGTGASAEDASPESSAEPKFDGDFVRRQVERNQPARFNEFLRSIGESSSPSFNFIHLLLPHVPHRYLPSGLMYSAPLFGYTADQGRSEEPWASQIALQRHLLQVAYTDRLLGQLLDRLEETGLYDRASVVLLSDHGDGFVPGEFPRRRLTQGNMAQLAWVPFILKKPWQRQPQVVDSNVLTIDVVPTIADALDITVPWPMEGVSALSGRRTTERKPWYEPGGVAKTVDPRRFSEVLAGFGLAAPREAGGLRLYKAGPLPELVGVDTAQIAKASPSQLTARLDGMDAYDNVDPTTGVLPALASGRLEGGTLRGVPGRLAVALNGTIGGVSDIFPDGHLPYRFASLLPESLFRPGANIIDLYLVEERNGRILLAPLRIKR